MAVSFFLCYFSLGSGTPMHKSSSLRWVYSINTFQQLCVFRCQGLRYRDENPIYTVVAETSKLLANSSYGNQMSVATIQLHSIRMMKRSTQFSTVKFSWDWGISTINFAGYSSPNLKSNINNQSLYASLSCTTLSWECWSSILTSSKNLSILTSMRK